MSLATRTSALATAVGVQIKATRTMIGTLSSLTTTDKTSVVAAINEVKASGGGGGAPTGTKTSALTAAGTLTGTETVPGVQSGSNVKMTTAAIAALAAAGGEVVKTVAATRTNATTTPTAISDFTTSLTPGTYRIRADLIWRSAATGAGAGFFINCSGGAVSRNVGHVYTTTTGSTATTGVADQATAAASFQMIEARAWRANNTDPGPFGGVDTAASDQLCIMEAIVVVTTTTSLQVMFDSEDTTQMAIQTGSVLQIKGPT